MRGLLRRREQLARVANDIKDALSDLQGVRRQVSYDTTCMAAWASVLMTVDIIKAGVSAVDPRAAFGFALIDEGIKRANLLLVGLGKQPITTRSDLMKSVDPNLRTVTGMLGDVRTAKKLLAAVRISPHLKVGVPKEITLLVDISISMAENTTLLMQAGQSQAHANAHIDSAGRQMRAHLQKVHQSLRSVDAAIAQLLATHALYSRTA